MAARRGGRPVGFRAGQLDQPAPPAWRAGIGIAVLDPYRGYATALRTVLGAAVRVLDAFHVIRLGFAAVDAIRCRIQRGHTGHRVR